MHVSNSTQPTNLASNLNLHLFSLFTVWRQNLTSTVEELTRFQRLFPAPFLVSIFRGIDNCLMVTKRWRLVVYLMLLGSSPWLFLSKSRSSLFNDKSAPSGLFIVRQWAPGRKIQYPLGSREPMPLWVMDLKYLMSFVRRWKIYTMHCTTSNIHSGLKYPEEPLSRHGQWTQDWIDKAKWRSIYSLICKQTGLFWAI